MEHQLIWLTLVIRSASIMICNQDKVLIFSLVDELPLYQSMAVSDFGFKGQGQGSAVSVAVYFLRKALEFFQQDYFQSVWSLEGQIGKK